MEILEIHGAGQPVMSRGPALPSRLSAWWYAGIMRLGSWTADLAGRSGKKVADGGDIMGVCEKSGPSVLAQSCRGPCAVGCETSIQVHGVPLVGRSGLVDLAGIAVCQNGDQIGHGLTC